MGGKFFIIDKSSFGTGILLKIEHSPQEFKESKLSEFFWDEVDIVEMVEFDGEKIVISLGGVWFEFSMVLVDEETFYELQHILWIYYLLGNI